MNRGGLQQQFFFVFCSFEGQIELVDLVDLNRLMIVVGMGSAVNNSDLRPIPNQKISKRRP